MNTRRAQAQAVIEEEDLELATRLLAANDRIAAAEAELARRKRDRAAVVGEAAAAGWSDRRVGKVLGLSKARVAQLRRQA